MRFRLGLMVGLAIGYVLGAKAGRERYVQIQSWGRQLARSEPAQQISGEVRSAAARAGDKLESKASEGVAKVTNLVRDGGESSGGSHGSPTAPTSAPPV